MARDERLEALDLERPIAVSENIAHQLSVNAAHELLIRVEKVVVPTGCEVEPQRLLVDDGIQADIVEMLVEHIDLP